MLKAGALCKHDGYCAPGSIKPRLPISPACKQSMPHQGTAAWPLPTAQRCCCRLRVSMEVQHPPTDTWAKPQHSRCQAPRTAAPRATAIPASRLTKPKENLKEKKKRQLPSSLVKQRVCLQTDKSNVGRELSKPAGVPTGISASQHP